MNILIIYPLMIGTTELVVLGALALLLFGGKKLPGLMKSMGQGVRQFKEGMTEAPNEFKKGIEGESPEKDKEPSIQNETENQKDSTLNGN